MKDCQNIDNRACGIHTPGKLLKERKKTGQHYKPTSDYFRAGLFNPDFAYQTFRTDYKVTKPDKSLGVL